MANMAKKSKFTVKQALLEVDIDYVELDDGETIFIIQDLEDKKKYKDKVQTATGYFDRPNWKNFNQYIKGCIEIDPATGSPTLDTITLRDKKFRYLLRKLKDGDGEWVHLDSNFFDHCIPEFAIALVEGYDNKINTERMDVLINDEFVKKVIDSQGIDINDLVDSPEEVKESKESLQEEKIEEENKEKDGENEEKDGENEEK